MKTNLSILHYDAVVEHHPDEPSSHDEPPAIANWRSVDGVVAVMRECLKGRDIGTASHCDRLVRRSRAFGRYLGLSYAEVDALSKAGILHDVGKMGIPDSILLKPGPLSEEEWTIMRRHPLVGERLLSPFPALRLVWPVVRNHHERWDGMGYPDRLAGEEIPLLARVFQLVDAFDALSNERPYKRAYSVDESLWIMEQETAKGKWDPVLFPRFESFILGWE